MYIFHKYVACPQMLSKTLLYWKPHQNIVWFGVYSTWSICQSRLMKSAEKYIGISVYRCQVYLMCFLSRFTVGLYLSFFLSRLLKSLNNRPLWSIIVFLMRVTLFDKQYKVTFLGDLTKWNGSYITYIHISP